MARMKIVMINAGYFRIHLRFKHIPPGQPFSVDEYEGPLGHEMFRNDKTAMLSDIHKWQSILSL